MRLPKWAWTGTGTSRLYTELLDISGGKERILHYWKQVHPDIKALDGQAVQDTHQPHSRTQDRRL